MSSLEIWAPDGLPEVVEGTDLGQLVAGAVDLHDGDIVLVTSKVVSKSEGRTRAGSREAAIAEETRRVVASRGPVAIVRNRLGLTMAAAGVDASNVSPGTVVLLPGDPDASAAAIRARLRALTGAVVGVVVTDTAGRAWRLGQTDIAIGAAGLRVAEDFAGRTDPYGNDLHVTLPAVADELAGAAELAQGKLGGRPVAVVRGRSDLVLPEGQDGPGARSLVRPEGEDLFGYGTREAVVRALVGDAEQQQPFGRAVTMADLVAAIARVPLDRASVAAVAYAHGWVLDQWDDNGSDAVAHVSPRTT